MLTYPDKHRFEQVRAHWETVERESDSATGMASRKDKQTVQQPQTASVDATSGGSKFRRKLSYGLSFISNPLSQRKITNRRQQSDNQSTKVTTPRFDPVNGVLSGTQNLPVTTNHVLSQQQRRGSLLQPLHQAVINMEVTNDRDATPRPPLPRSRTMSMIPRPRFSGSFGSAGDVRLASPSSTTPTPPVNRSACKTPSKIPSPSPPRDASCLSTPRQYTRQHTIQETKLIAAGAAFGVKSAQSPSKSSIRSYATPTPIHSPDFQRPNFMMPRKIASQQTRIPESSGVQWSGKKENRTNANSDSRVTSQVPGNEWRRSSLVPQPIATTRRSFGPGSALNAGKQVARASPSAETPRLSSKTSAQTPLTAKRVSNENKSGTLAPVDTNCHSNGGSIPQARLIGPVNPPSSYQVEQLSNRLDLTRTSTEKDFYKMLIKTPSRRSGESKSPRPQAGSRHEVRLPRSSTFHAMRRSPETPPPVPPIPAKYKTSSQPNLHPMAFNAHPPLAIVEEATSGPNTSECFDWYYPSGTAQSSPFITDPEDNDVVDSQEESPPHMRGNFLFANSNTVKPQVHDWHKGDNNTDDLVKLQVRDYMPPLWWAGRFQTRFDQWRAEAMRSELSATYVMEGPLNQFRVGQDRAVVCAIFIQLRLLCATEQAVDGLWAFEYKYPQHHQLLGSMTQPPPISRKQNENTNPKQGTIGRAVRKLTPRKSSFVNLLKGKGWNKTDDQKTTSEYNEQDVLSSTTQRPSSDSDY
ncbi:hypothetical protein B0J11DRAFT_422146 [Dendryphion nanum]|uniref:Uncharacterized protein n=1 Tax=Dendryphion nanum TaxID=256645 RepID=A0A9P9EGR6_9PLEO|nr:hypothetical protein B0J11DRAFT_422146 [Dendryphion nanum]